MPLQPTQSASSLIYRSSSPGCWLVSIKVQAADGRILPVRLELQEETQEWTCQSDTHHPLLAQHQPLCRHVMPRLTEVTTEAVACLVDDASALFASPRALCKDCVKNPLAMREYTVNSALFWAKAVGMQVSGPSWGADEHSEQILAMDRQALLITGTFTDLKIIIGSTVFRVHSPVLKSASSALHEAAVKCSSRSGVWWITDVAPAVYARLLQYVYQGTIVRIASLQDNVALLKLSREYRLTELAKSALVTLTSLASGDNACDLAVAAEEIGDEKFVAATTQYLIKHLGSAMKSGGWAKVLACPGITNRLLSWIAQPAHPTPPSPPLSTKRPHEQHRFAPY